MINHKIYIFKKNSIPRAFHLIDGQVKKMTDTDISKFVLKWSLSKNFRQQIFNFYPFWTVGSPQAEMVWFDYRCFRRASLMVVMTKLIGIVVMTRMTVKLIMTMMIDYDDDVGDDDDDCIQNEWFSSAAIC